MSSRVCCKLEVIVRVGNVCGYRLNTSKMQNLVCFLKASSVQLSTIHAFIFTVKQKGVTGYLTSFPGLPCLLVFGLYSVNHRELKSGDCVNANWRTNNGRSPGMRLLPTVMYMCMSNVICD